MSTFNVQFPISVHRHTPGFLQESVTRRVYLSVDAGNYEDAVEIIRKALQSLVDTKSKTG